MQRVQLSNYTLKALIRTTSPTLSVDVLERRFTWLDVISAGISCTLGAGIFVLTGQMAYACGPSVVFSYILAFIAAILSGFCFAEFSVRVPTSGSAYSYAYCSLGELTAFIVSWAIFLEYILGVSAIARGWASNLLAFIGCFDQSLKVPDWVDAVPLGSLTLNPLSVTIVVLMTFLPLAGAKESATIGIVLTAINCLLIIFVIIVGAFVVDPSNWQPFVPNGLEAPLRNTGTAFFSYVGFECATMMGGEVKRPARDLPIGVIGTLAVVALLYFGFSLVLTGIVSYTTLNNEAPAVNAFIAVGLTWAGTIVAAGAVLTMTANIFVSLFAVPRVLFQMAEDGLLFRAFAHRDCRGNLAFGTLFCGAVSAVFALFFSLNLLGNALSLSALLFYTIVDMGVLAMRYRNRGTSVDTPLLLALYLVLCALSALSIQLAWPGYLILLFAIPPAIVILWFWLLFEINAPPPTFSCPFSPLVECGGIWLNIIIALSLGWESIGITVLLMLVGLVIYFAYGIHFSQLNKTDDRSQTDSRPVIN